jgi:(p)ppGpp synthase/HD superfamily hydrolase
VNLPDGAGHPPAGLAGPELLAAALRIAAAAHAAQPDKAGNAYLGHPLRVAARLVNDGDQAVAVGLLHDVIEDTETTVEDLRAAGIPEPVIRAVEALTKKKDEPYEQVIARAAADTLAVKVKAADLADNADPARLALINDAAERARLEAKYANGRRLLEEHTSEASELAEAERRR